MNSARGNKLYALSDPGSPGYRNPAHVESALATADSDSWEPPAHQRGDIARALFYMATRYTGDTNNEPALILTDRLELIQATNTYMGRLSTLLAWHESDPVDDAERLRNDLVYTWQTNRNPYIDRPEWVRVIFWPNLEISPEPGGTRLSWSVEYNAAVLQSTATLPATWNTVTNAATTQNNRLTVLLRLATQPQFFRLRLP